MKILFCDDKKWNAKKYNEVKSKIGCLPLLECEI
jgi:hypothetical protein